MVGSEHAIAPDGSDGVLDQAELGETDARGGLDDVDVGIHLEFELHKERVVSGVCHRPGQHLAEARDKA